MRRRLRELIAMLGGKVIHPVFGLPGGVAKGAPPTRLPQLPGAGARTRSSSRTSRCRSSRTSSSKNQRVRRTSSPRTTYTHRTYYMGLVDEQQLGQLLRRPVRVVDPSGKEFAKFAAAEYLDYIAEHVEPWSYVKFCYLKPVGLEGLHRRRRERHLLRRPAGAAERRGRDGHARWRRRPTRSSSRRSAASRCITRWPTTGRASIEMLHAAERMRGARQRPGDHRHGDPHAPDGNADGGRRRRRGPARHAHPSLRDGRARPDHEGEPDRGDAEQRGPHRDERGQGARRA